MLTKLVRIVVAASATLAACVVVTAGCSSSSAPAGPVTFHKDVEPIVQAHCQGCHTPDGIAPFSLLTYDTAKDYASAMAAQTKARTMPPWGATDTATCKPRFPWQHDPRLSDAEVATLQEWSAQGAKEGDPKDAPPAVTQTQGLAGAQTTLAPAVPYDLGAATTDAFRCFVLDPKIAQTQYISGTDIIPGNKEIVHHVLVFAASAADVAKKTLGPDGGYDCFGGAGINSASLVMGWAPGALPQDFPPNVGMKIDPGTMLVMQIHYHPHVAVKSTADSTKFLMRTTPTVPEYNLTAALLGNFDQPFDGSSGIVYDSADPNALATFAIPANAKGKTITQRFVIPPILNGKPTPEIRILGIGGHMHWVGTEVRIDVHRTAPPDDAPGDECLLDIPKWDFNWQRVYRYDTPLEMLPSVKQFDEVTITCTYDNTLANPKVADALRDQSLTAPRDVKLGETTLDEMCLGVFLSITKS